MSQHTDIFFMRQALELAQKAFDQNEVPIGAIVIDQNGTIIGRGFNQVEGCNPQCAHAEMRAIQQAAQTKNDWRLDGCTMYVTLEPCRMCSSLMRLSRL